MPLLSSIFNYFGANNSPPNDQSVESGEPLLLVKGLSSNNNDKVENFQLLDQDKMPVNKKIETQAKGTVGNNYETGETTAGKLHEDAESPGKENRFFESNDVEISDLTDVMPNGKNASNSISLEAVEDFAVTDRVLGCRGTEFNADQSMGDGDDFFDAVSDTAPERCSGDENILPCSTLKNIEDDKCLRIKDNNAEQVFGPKIKVETNDEDEDITVKAEPLDSNARFNSIPASIQNTEMSLPIDFTTKKTDPGTENESTYEAGNIQMNDVVNRTLKKENIKNEDFVILNKEDSYCSKEVEMTDDSSLKVNCTSQYLSDCLIDKQLENKLVSSDVNIKLEQNGLFGDMPRVNSFTSTDSRSSFGDMDEGSNLSGASSHSKVTQSMVEEEEQYVKENLCHVKGEGIKELEAAAEDQRFDRLKHLLDRSNVYAQFLLKRIDQQREGEKERKEKRLKIQEKRAATFAKKREEKNAAKSASQESTEKQDIDSKSSRKNKEKKRKRVDDSCQNENDSSSQETGKNTSKKQKTDLYSANEQLVPDCSGADQSKQMDNISPKAKKSDTEIKDIPIRTINGEVVSERQPMLLTGGVLRSYQIDGMEWLKGLFENGINGILADEMGLGKTLQCISLLTYLIEKGIKGPYLIAAPLSTLSNWVSEFKKFCPKVTTLLYHGTKEERAKMRMKINKLYRIDEKTRLRSFPVVITSYEIIMRDRSDLCNHAWKYIIIDEGHRIKNLNCRLIRELKTYKTANRLLLTGTPLQNNLAELWSLLNFLLPDIFDDLNSFQEWFDFSAVEEDGGHEKIIAQEKEAHVLETLHAILTPFLLRRLKTDVDLSIPPKRELIVYAPLTEVQQVYYKGTLDRTILDRIKIKAKPPVPIEYTQAGRPKRKSTKGISYTSIYGNDDENEDDDDDDFDFDSLLEKIEAEEERRQDNETKKTSSKFGDNAVVHIKMQNILMQLRKCCNHPYLLEYPLDPVTKDFKVDENIIKVSGKMLVLDRMLAELKTRGHKVLLFSQMTSMLDIIQDYCYWKDYGFSRLDGRMKISERQEMIERFNTEPDVFLFLLSTRAGGLGINLSSADTCIIYDSDWNPQADLQAQDRCHRIGQTKPVLIFRLVTANTVDESIVDRAASKRKLEKMVIHKGRFKGREVSNKLSPQDLLDLLKSKDHGQFSGIEDDVVITDECLNQLLDRSTLTAAEESSNDPGLSKPINSDVFKVVKKEEENMLF